MHKKELAFKCGDRVAIVLFNLCLLLLSIIIPAFIVASSPSWYHTQFEKTGIYATVNGNGEEERTLIYYVGGKPSQRATFSDAQFDEMVDHIITFLFTDRESFALTMDGVMLNGEMTDGVEIFGETSVGHMLDVKNLFRFFLALGGVLFVLFLGLIGYGIWRWKAVKGILLKYSIGFYATFLTLIGAFCLWVVIGLQADGRAVTADNFADKLWDNFHHLIFPFQDEKFANSFFNDTLTQILTLDFFLNAVVTVLIVVSAVLVLWFGSLVFLRVWERKKGKDQNLDSSLRSE